MDCIYLKNLEKTRKKCWAEATVPPSSARAATRRRSMWSSRWAARVRPSRRQASSRQGLAKRTTPASPRPTTARTSRATAPPGAFRTSRARARAAAAPSATAPRQRARRDTTRTTGRGRARPAACGSVRESPPSGQTPRTRLPCSNVVELSATT